jgi:hypothetical protein
MGEFPSPSARKFTSIGFSLRAPPRRDSGDRMLAVSAAVAWSVTDGGERVQSIALRLPDAILACQRKLVLFLYGLPAAPKKL